MEYEQIVTLLFVVLLGYYAFLIVSDLQKARTAQLAEQENQMEEDIDISDEAQNFHPKQVGRKGDEMKEGQQVKLEKSSTKDASQHPTPSSELNTAINSQEKIEKSKKTFQRQGYREAIMTDGIGVDELIRQIEKLAETGCSDLGNVIYQCESAR